MLYINKLVEKRQTDEHSRCGWSCRGVTGTCKWTHSRNPQGGDRARPGGVYLPLKALPSYKKSNFAPLFPFLLRANHRQADPLRRVRDWLQSCAQAFQGELALMT